MCGRFVAASPRDVLADHFGVGVDHTVEELPLSYNVAPTDEVAVVAGHRGTRTLDVMSWGLHGRINARAETLLERPAFRDPFLHRRCLIPADGFYEWETVPGGTKQPWLFSSSDDGVLAFAGLWTAGTCTIVTTAATEPVIRLHDRMPVVVVRHDWDAWLDVGGDISDLHPLLHPKSAALRARRVSTRVNDVRNNDPSLVDAVPPPPEPLALF